VYVLACSNVDQYHANTAVKFYLEKVTRFVENYNFHQNQTTAINIAHEDSRTLLHAFRAQATHMQSAIQK
jgi:hypothetical protein